MRAATGAAKLLETPVGCWTLAHPNKHHHSSSETVGRTPSRSTISEPTRALGAQVAAPAGRLRVMVLVVAPRHTRDRRRADTNERLGTDRGWRAGAPCLNLARQVLSPTRSRWMSVSLDRKCLREGGRLYFDRSANSQVIAIRRLHFLDQMATWRSMFFLGGRMQQPWRRKARRTMD
jgi:hypothetical protein